MRARRQPSRQQPVRGVPWPNWFGEEPLGSPVAAPYRWCGWHDGGVGAYLPLGEAFRGNERLLDNLQRRCISPVCQAARGRDAHNLQPTLDQCLQLLPHLSVHRQGLFRVHGRDGVAAATVAKPSHDAAMQAPAPVDNSAQEAAHLRTAMLRVQQFETARDTQQVSTVFRRQLTAWRKEVSSAEDEDEVSPLFLELLVLGSHRARRAWRAGAGRTRRRRGGDACWRRHAGRAALSRASLLVCARQSRACAVSCRP